MSTSATPPTTSNADLERLSEKAEVEGEISKTGKENVTEEEPQTETTRLFTGIVDFFALIYLRRKKYNYERYIFLSKCLNSS